MKNRFGSKYFLLFPAVALLLSCQRDDNCPATYTTIERCPKPQVWKPDIYNWGELYPNPNNGYFTINFSGKGEGRVLMELIDLTGKAVYSISRPFVSDVKEHTFRLDNKYLQLSSGIYTLRCKFKETKQVFRIIIVKE